VRELGDVPKGDIPKRPLDTADVRAMQICLFSQALLRPASLGTQLADCRRNMARGPTGIGRKGE
jgi:hypothetical protein